MRKTAGGVQEQAFAFLSSNAQDFIEELGNPPTAVTNRKFLSSNAQDFIEETSLPDLPINRRMTFLSSNAQDFIEDWRRPARTPRNISNS